ncbi:lipoprotein lipase-like isoform X2 [Protopterus annectens]|uniref:lipoprotein lipase-like isoform X2 n=1 Tax=Protopterus annectens TaxID=7888 RepID=UPI001CFC2A51|nr:lipoprotein lipase-like isoform X2 [Protopterus annectens]
MKRGIHWDLVLLALSLSFFNLHVTANTENDLDDIDFTGETKQDTDLEDSNFVHTRFSLRTQLDPEEDMCYIVPGHVESLHKCNFNVTTKTFLVIHGWTVSGMFESWIPKLVKALYQKEHNANVIVVDWLNRAHQHYSTAAENTKLVGQDIAKFINWLEETVDVPVDSLHLIGYSLGAHVAGFAGSHATSKVGRITGLDPAGPAFEDMHPHGRLSPDDATFVDVLHTFTHGSLGLSIGIKQPVGHIDIYPNGGSFQPGCNLHSALEKIAAYGFFEFAEAAKCEHERSVHLFIDSILHEDKASLAYRCSSKEMFDKGVCLQCHKRRCNTLGYNAKKVRNKRSSRMYLKTRAEMPFRVYHYQMKITFHKDDKDDIKMPSLLVSLYGTEGDAENLIVNIKEKIVSNKTYSFLLVSDVDIGNLLRMKLKWEDQSTWGTLPILKTVYSWLPRNYFFEPGIEVEKIFLKSGETQNKRSSRKH